MRRAPVAPRRSRGQSPSASSGRWVTPTVGRSSSAPRCRARPARRGWSRAVPSTSNTSGTSVSPRTTCSSTGPTRSASSPGSYGAPAAPEETRTATALPSRTTTAALHAASPGRPGPEDPRGKQTQQPPVRTWPTGGRHARDGAVASQRCRATSASPSAGHMRPSSTHRSSTVTAQPGFRGDGETRGDESRGVTVTDQPTSGNRWEPTSPGMRSHDAPGAYAAPDPDPRTAQPPPARAGRRAGFAGVAALLFLGGSAGGFALDHQAPDDVRAPVIHDASRPGSGVTDPDGRDDGFGPGSGDPDRAPADDDDLGQADRGQA